jgi:3-methyladenine DNA glycosylase AlkC
MPALLKDNFNQALVTELAKGVQAAWPEFPARHFQKRVLDSDWEERELKQRVRHIATCLGHTLPDDYRAAIRILRETSMRVQGWTGMVYPDFVELYGLDDWKTSISALAYFTPVFSSELAVRPFILRDPERMLSQMQTWSRNRNHHIRRLASEGCRPRLPWAMALPALKKDPRLILPILEELKDDPELYVRRSVANNLNDIAKDNPKITLKLAKAWRGKSAETDWVTKHGCRTLLKQAHPDALALFGFASASDARVTELALASKTVRIGGRLDFSFSLLVKRSTRARVEYAIDYVKSRGQHSRKIFKITENTYAKGSHEFARRQSFADMSIRKHYAGEHRISILNTGAEKADAPFRVRG